MTDLIDPVRARLEKRLQEWAGFKGVSCSQSDLRVLLDHDKRMTVERDAAVAEMHQRELHHFETEQQLAELQEP